MRRTLVGLVAVLAVAGSLLVGAPAQASVPQSVTPVPQFVERAIAASEANCNPSSGWTVKGAFSNGDVMESRACFIYGSGFLGGRIDWRLRNGGTPISGAIWDVDTPDGAGGAYYRARLVRQVDLADITYRSYTSDFSGSFFRTETPLDCDHTYNSAAYFALSRDIRVYNPRTGTKSGWHQHNNAPTTWPIGCP